MGLFKSKNEKELDSIISRMEMNMANNYKDNAQSNLAELEQMLAQMENNHTLSEKSLKYYRLCLANYQARLKGYTHKDQTPYWTK